MRENKILPQPYWAQTAFANSGHLSFWSLHTAYKGHEGHFLTGDLWKAGENTVTGGISLAMLLHTFITYNYYIQLILYVY